MNDFAMTGAAILHANGNNYRGIEVYDRYSRAAYVTLKESTRRTGISFMLGGVGGLDFLRQSLLQTMRNG